MHPNIFNINYIYFYFWGLPFSTYAPRGGGSSLLYISIAYHMQNGGGWVQIACKIEYVLNGRSLCEMLTGLLQYHLHATHT